MAFGAALFMTLLVGDLAEVLLEGEPSLLGSLKRGPPPWTPGQIRVKVPFFTSTCRILRIWGRT